MRSRGARSRFGGDGDAEPGPGGGVLCPACRGDFLNLHQPDIDLPDKLLGTCPLCKAWYVILADGAVVTPVPDGRREP